MSPRLPQRPGPMRMNCRLGKSLFSLPNGAANVAHVLFIGKMTVAFEIDVNDVRDLGHLAVGDEAIGGKDDALWSQIRWNGNGRGIDTVALGTALQKIEVVAVVGELEVDRLAQLGLQQAQQLANVADERRLANQAFEGEDHGLLVQIG